MGTKILKQRQNPEVFLRPRFSVELNQSFDWVLEHFKERLHNNPEKLPYKQVDGHIILDVPPRENHYWSPQLHLEIREHKEDKNLSYLKGVLGPKTQVWTMFVFLHVGMALALTVFGIRGYVYWTLDKEDHNSGVIVLAICVLWILLYLFARWGRAKGNKQTRFLIDFVKRVLEIEN